MRHLEGGPGHSLSSHSHQGHPHHPRSLRKPSLLWACSLVSPSTLGAGAFCFCLFLTVWLNPRKSTEWQETKAQERYWEVGFASCSTKCTTLPATCLQRQVCMQSLYLLGARKRKPEQCNIQMNSSVNDPFSLEGHRHVLLWFPIPWESAGVLDGNHHHLSRREQFLSLAARSGHHRVFKMEAVPTMDPL